MISTEKKYGHFVSAEAEKIIANSHRLELEAKEIQKEIKSELKETVFQKVISEKLKLLNMRKKKIGDFKKRGSKIVSQFLEKVKDDTDTSDLQAILANAVYRDLLNRYATQEDLLDEIPVKDLLKITTDYEKLRLSAIRGDKSADPKDGISAEQAAGLLDVFENELNGNRELKKLFVAKKNLLTEKLKKMFAKGEFEIATIDYETIQRLKEKHERSMRTGADA